MSKKRIELEKKIALIISEFSKYEPLNGIKEEQILECLVKQIVDSERRVRYYQILASRDYDKSFTDIADKNYDPIKASLYYYGSGDIDESFWLAFLAVHFGKNAKTGWSLMQNVYSGLGTHTWMWKNIVQDVNGFKHWLNDNKVQLASKGSFSNHRKYESLNAYEKTGTGHVIESYINYIQTFGGHENWKKSIIDNNTEKANDSYYLFDLFYKDLKIARFGRTGKFDLLCTLGKLKLLPIEPGKIYLSGATGPLRGAGLLFDDDISTSRNRNEYEKLLAQLNLRLGFPFGMQIIEDALCNWQKKPSNYKFYH
jgi:hypothetical protein